MSKLREQATSTARESMASTFREQKLTVRDKIVTLKENIIPKKQGAFY
jgi:hypothetical protein